VSAFGVHFRKSAFVLTFFNFPTEYSQTETRRPYRACRLFSYTERREMFMCRYVRTYKL